MSAPGMMMLVFPAMPVNDAPAPEDEIVTPEEYGWSELNTPLENAAAFQAAIAAAETGPKGPDGLAWVECVPGKAYVMATTNGLINDPEACVTLASNVGIRTAGSPTRASGLQAVLQIESWAGKSGYHNQVVVLVDGSITNWRLESITVNGNMLTMGALADPDYTQGQSGGLHCVAHYDGSEGQVREVILEDAICDGYHVQNAAEIAPAHLMEDCTIRRCRRQGVSGAKIGAAAAGLSQFVMRRIGFQDIGDNIPGASLPGQQPGAGIGIRPATVADGVYGVRLEACSFERIRGSVQDEGTIGPESDGAAILWESPSQTTGVRIINCTIDGCRNAVQWKQDGSANADDVLIEGLISINQSNDDRLRLESIGTVGGTLTNFRIVNPQISAAGDGDVWVDPNLAAVGHSVQVWQGVNTPGVDNVGGLVVITLNPGFPVEDPISTYGDKVLALAPDLYLPLEVDIKDRVSGRDAQVRSGREWYGAPIVDGSTGSFDTEGGLNSLRILHDAALKGALGSLILWVRPASVQNAVVVAMDEPGDAISSPNEMAARVNNLGGEGTVSQYWQTPAGSTVVQTNVNRSYYAPGDTIFLGATWGSSAVRMHLDSNMPQLWRNTGHTTGLEGNILDIIVGAMDGSDLPFDGLFAHLALWNGKVLTAEEFNGLMPRFGPAAGPS